MSPGFRLPPAPLPPGAPSRVEQRPVVIVGAGLVGLTLAIDLRLRGVDVLVLEKGDRLSEGSRSICQAKRSLEIWDRLGVGTAIRDRGVTWSRGRVFHGARELYQFDLTREPGAKMPAFVNLQQYHVEALLHARLAALGGEVRATHALAGLSPRSDHVLAEVETPVGGYQIEAEWLVSCEGVRSVARRALGLEFSGQRFADRFLIADVVMQADFPTERWFWFEPPFHDGQTALLHRQADDVWRIDLQLGPEADAEAERQPERARPRIAAMLGHDRFSFAWLSVYAFQCRTLDRYVHGRVLFAGDSAHQVSPFGARGGNGGVQDADNLGWKLVRVVQGTSPASLLDSYCRERSAAAAENIAQSTRTTDFMVPGSPSARAFRDSILASAATDPFARRLVNAGRLSTAFSYPDSPLSSPDDAPGWPAHAPTAGTAAIDAPLHGRDGHHHLVEQLAGNFTLLARSPEPMSGADGPAPCATLHLDDRREEDAAAAELYGLAPGAAVLFRPDQHVAARLVRPTPATVAAAVGRASGRDPSQGVA